MGWRASVNVWITSDAHFNHTKILTYCNRPFANVDEMNDTIVKNWNETIAKEDLVYFLGDLCFGDQDVWLNKLNGRIQWIRGNHDRSIGKGRHYYKFLPVFSVLRYANLSIMLVHDPNDECVSMIADPKWVIYGHHHNNYPEQYPFFDAEKKRVNVSVEMTEYKPVSLTLLFDKILEVEYEKKSKRD